MTKKLNFLGAFILAAVFIILTPYSLANKKINYLRAEVIIRPDYQIKSDQVWTAEQGPYIIQENCPIVAGAKLTIRPGTIVKFYEAGRIYSFGEIKVEGTAADPVYFTSIYDNAAGGDNCAWSDKSPWPGSWGTITSIYGGRIIADHAIFKYGGNNQAISGGLKSGVIFVWAGSGQVNIINSEFTENIRALFNYLNSDAPVAINNSKIYNNAYGGVWASFIISNNYSGSHINVTNNWWGHESGPYYKDFNPDGQGNAITVFPNPVPINPVHIVFDPWVGKESVKEPVIIVPGIMGSYLNRNNEAKDEIWPNLERMLLSIDDEYLDELVLNSSGLPADYNTIAATGVIKKIATEDMWQGLISELKANGYAEDKNLFYFPYDWRLNISDVAGGSGPEPIKTLRAKIAEVRQQTGAGKVDIIAHSLGGLVVKAYMQKFGTTSVDKFIDIATPHLGAPKAFKILMYGDDLDIKITKYLSLNQEKVKYISQNMPAVYQLLPSLNYFSGADADNYYLYDMPDFDSNGINGRLSYEATQNFLANTGRNNLLLNSGAALHYNIDNYSPQDAGVKTYNLVGCGNPTIGRIYVLNKEKSGGYEYGLKYINGDGTVPLRSADYLKTVDLGGHDLINSASKYYVKSAPHSGLPALAGVRQFVVSALKNKADSFLFLNYPNLAKAETDCGFSGTQVSYHSPVEMHIYDENNNHLGPDENGDLETGIPGAQYDIIGNNKFAFLPAGHSYRVIGQATASGTCNARIENISNGQYRQTAYFNEIDLAGTGTRLMMEIDDDNENVNLRIDRYGDGFYEAEAGPSAILNAEESNDLTKPATAVNLTGGRGANGFYVAPVTVNLEAGDDLSGVLKTEYSLNNGAVWQIYLGPFLISADGDYHILYRSTDRAGNVEAEQINNFKIDATGPCLTVNLPYDRQIFLRSDKLAADYSISDNLSGVAGDSVKIYIDGSAINPAGAIDFFNYQLGRHALKITAEDQAGNLSASEINFMVAADISSILYDINRLNSEGALYKAEAKDHLVLKLEQIREYIVNKAAKTEERDENIAGLISKCAELNKTGCADKFNNYLNKIIYHLAEQDRHYVAGHLEILARQLDIFYSGGWLKPAGYDMIKEDLIYLINNI